MFRVDLDMYGEGEPIKQTYMNHRVHDMQIRLVSHCRTPRKFPIFLSFSSKQKDLYDETFRDLVQSVLDGFNGTIFAYGQTGTGKTFTMQGTGLTQIT